MVVLFRSDASMTYHGFAASFLAVNTTSLLPGTLFELSQIETEEQDGL